MSRYEITREEHEQELAASHARSEAEERDEPLHDWRMRLFREIDSGMKSMLNEVNDTDTNTNDFDFEPF